MSSILVHDDKWGQYFVDIFFCYSLFMCHSINPENQHFDRIFIFVIFSKVNFQHFSLIFLLLYSVFVCPFVFLWRIKCEKKQTKSIRFAFQKTSTWKKFFFLAFTLKVQRHHVCAQCLFCGHTQYTGNQWNLCEGKCLHSRVCTNTNMSTTFEYENFVFKFLLYIHCNVLTTCVCVRAFSSFDSLM